MSNQYKEFKDNYSKTFNSFPMFAAFSDEQFQEGMKKLQVKSNTELYSIAYSVFIRKSDKEDFYKMEKKHEEEYKLALANDTDGTGFIKDMFRYELSDHEYIITGDLTDTLDALGMTVEKVNSSDSLLNGLYLAKEEYMRDQEL